MTDSPMLLDGEQGFLGFASRPNPLMLPAGMLQLSRNMRLDRGVAQTRKGAKRLADDVDTSAVPPLSLPFELGVAQTITELTEDSGTATATVEDHGFTSGDRVHVSGADQAAYNGDHEITVTGDDTFTFAVTGSPTSPATGTITVEDGPIIQSSYATGIYAMGVFSSPNYDNAREYIVLASGAKAYFWRQGAKSFAKNYPSSADETIEDSDEVSVLQAFNRLYVLRRAPLYGLEQEITVLTSSGTTATATVPGHGFVNGQSVRISNVEPNGYNGIYVIAFVDSNSFTYTLADALASPAGSVAGLKMRAEGATAFAPKAITSGGITVSSTTATVNLVGHGFPVGSTIRIEGSDVPAFHEVEYEVATVGTDSFTIAVPSGTSEDTTTTGRTVRRVKPPLYWDGGAGEFVRAARGVPAEGVTYRRMQSVGWASYINNRIWLASERDNVRLSDVLDPDLYDPFFQSFRTNQGSADYIVGIHPWVEGQALVFLRNSIWLAQLKDSADVTTGLDWSFDEEVTRLTLLTDEIGLVARESVATAGQFVYFLSDSGVYRLDSRLDLKLRGDTRPLSDAVTDEFEALRGDLAHLAVGRWFANRYWLAVPRGAGATANNVILIYNALNEAWESRDTYDFPINKLLVTTYNNQRRLFAGSNTGRLYLLDEVEGGDMGETGAEMNEVTGFVRSRRYGMGTLRSKRFLRMVAEAVLPAGGTLTARARALNPDLTRTVLTRTYTGPDASEDFVLKAPLRQTASGLEMDVEMSGGRGALRGLTLEAAGYDRSPTNTRSKE